MSGITDIGFFFYVALLFLCVSIHMRWFDSLMGIPVDRLRNIGVYFLFAGISFLAFMLIAQFRETMIYRANKGEILSSLRRNKLSIEYLLAEIANDEKLSRIRDKMIHDKDIQQESGGYRR